MTHTRVLTDREREVLAQLAQGQSIAGAARALGIQPAAARYLYQQCQIKFGAMNRAETLAVYRAQEEARRGS